MIYSRDVKFNESEFGFEKESSSEPARYIELEVSSSVDESEEPGTVEPEEPDTEASREAVVEEPVIRRSGRVRHRPDYYGESVSIAKDGLEEPTTVSEALTSQQKVKWKEAMEAEMRSLQDNDVWDLMELPKGRKSVGCKWVFKVKTNEDGDVERYKARLVAQGFMQVKGADYDETFCPVVRMESLRALVAMSVQRGMELHQLDITTAFLNGTLEEEVFMRQPEGFVVEGQEELVCRLKRSLYGLKQSPRCWNSTLDDYLKQLEFMRSANDPCIYVAPDGEMLVGVYVDDIVVAGKIGKMVEDFKRALGEKFDVKDLGRLHYFLGMKIVQDQTSGNVWMGQPAYTDKVLEKFGMKDAKSVSTPVDLSMKLVKSEGEEKVDQGMYQSAVGSLLYLSTGTRPDITFAVSKVAKFCSDPDKCHWIAVKRILRYLNGTRDLGLLYAVSVEGQECFGYSDSDWAGDLDDRKSTSGYIFMLCGAGISWRSKKQASVALSTAEAEYIALSGAVQEAIWLRQLTLELSSGDVPKGATVIHEDNQSAISLAKNPQFHGRAKHIDIRHHFVREKVNDGTIELNYCRTDDMVADMLTKGLNTANFQRLRKMAGVTSIPTHFSLK